MSRQGWRNKVGSGRLSIRPRARLIPFHRRGCHDRIRNSSLRLRLCRWCHVSVVTGAWGDRLRCSSTRGCSPSLSCRGRIMLVVVPRVRVRVLLLCGSIILRTRIMRGTCRGLLLRVIGVITPRLAVVRSVSSAILPRVIAGVRTVIIRGSRCLLFCDRRGWCRCGSRGGRYGRHGWNYPGDFDVNSRVITECCCTALRESSVPTSPVFKWECTVEFS